VCLADVTTPLWRMTYEEQLKKKQLGIEEARTGCPARAIAG
jgi:hypothetical protein